MKTQARTRHHPRVGHSELAHHTKTRVAVARKIENNHSSTWANTLEASHAHVFHLPSPCLFNNANSDHPTSRVDSFILTAKDTFPKEVQT